ncbi:MAG TPA: dTDP-4-dehydrorhamnose 3,5-epimerase [Acidimicrobiales bacterium]|nr:dTDP-4-dehydrorhamnose 3,5-epimerase [Acidimicrobiales bacterium]
MKFSSCELPGVVVVDVEYFADARGGFARTFCRSEFEAAGLPATIEQSAISFNAKAGTLRGLHFQQPPNSQAKLVRVTAGAIFDVIVDLRPESATYGHHLAIELSITNRRMLFIPKRFAHGFLTLVDATEIEYQFDQAYEPGSEGGIHYGDPDLGIRWPRRVDVIADRDAALPQLRELTALR